MQNIQDILTGLLVPTNYTWAIEQIDNAEIDEKLKELFRQLLVRLYQDVNIIQVNLNAKDTGQYLLTPFLCGQQFFPNPLLNSSTSTNADGRTVFREVVNFGGLPNAGAKAVPHNIYLNKGFTFTRIYGAASDTTGLNYIPLPYASPTLVNNIELNVDGTNINIITGSNRTNFGTCYVVLEYIVD